MIAAILLAGAVLWLRLPATRRRSRESGVDLDGVVRLLALASSAGLPLGAALVEITRRMSGGVIDDLRSVVRAAKTEGLTQALLRSPESLRLLAPSLAHAHTAGAPVGATLDAFLERRRRHQVAVAVARARRLGVLLVIPLALMLLPGFILLVFGPFVMDNLTGLTAQ